MGCSGQLGVNFTHIRRSDYGDSGAAPFAAHHPHSGHAASPLALKKPGPFTEAVLQD